MATGVKFECFVYDTLLGKHDFDNDTLKIALTNTAPTAATDTVLGDITQITAEHGYSAGGSALANVTITETDGTATLAADDLTFTASGGSFGPFRYAVLYNDTAPGDPLIMYWDRGSSVTITTGNTAKIDFGSAVLSAV